MKELNQLKDLGRILSKEEQRRIRGGQTCTLRCNQDGGGEVYTVNGCSREYVVGCCGDSENSLDNAVCVCS